MQDNKTNTLTQDALVAELHKKGYVNVTVRRIATWRRHDLLPPFNGIGSGRGQRKGRECNSWSDGHLVINQAMWICQLLQTYKGFGDLHLPLWLLGYPVPLKRIRQSLSEPLDEMTEAVKAEAGSSGELEDAIGDAAYDYVKKIGHTGAQMLQIPQDSIEALINVFFNREYDLSDAPFEDGAKALQEHGCKIREKQSVLLAAKGIEVSSLPQRGEMEDFFINAPIIKEYFSLYQLKQAVDESTDGDFQAIERDIDVLREMVLWLHKMFVILTREMESDFDVSPAIILPPIFDFGKLIIWADLSLRHHGFSEVIDRSLREALVHIREEFNEKLERELIEASHTFALAVNTTCEVMVETFSPAVDDAQRVHQEG